MKTYRRLKVAVAGLGRIAWQYHIPSIINDDRFQLFAVVDPLTERLSEAKSQFDVSRGYQSVQSMLERETPDLMLIASPTCFHLEQAVSALKNNIDIICEKPLACSLEDAEKIQEAVLLHERKLMVYQPHRLTPEAIILKSIIKSGVLGKIFMVRRVCSDYNRRNDWQAFTAYGGGMLNNYGSHFLDQFIYLFGGGFKTVNAVTRKVASCGDAEDFVKIQAVNSGDIIFDLEINMGSAFAGNEWLVYGTCGSASCNNNTAGWKLKYFDPAQLKPVNVQTGLAAEGRMYPKATDIAWTENTIPAGGKSVFDNGFYDFCYRYFALDEPPLVPLKNTMEVMRTLEVCRK